MKPETGKIAEAITLCRLCKISKANQTGSHITSCFIVASVIGKRDEEKGFHFNSDPQNDYSDNRKANELKEDYILCLGCEKRLSFLESYFSQEFTNKVDREEFSQNFPITVLEDKYKTKYIECLNVNPIAFHLLIYSIIWRASISSKESFKDFILPDHAAETIRQILDVFLPEYVNHTIDTKLKTWLREIIAVQDLFYLYPYSILKSEDEIVDISTMTKEEKKEWELRKTKNFIHFNFHEKHPYHIILNEYIILIFVDNEEIDFETNDFFELSDKCDLTKSLNHEIMHPKIGVISHDHWVNVREKIFDIVKQQLIDNWRRLCIKEFINKGRIPTKFDIEQCVANKIRKISI